MKLIILYCCFLLLIPVKLHAQYFEPKVAIDYYNNAEDDSLYNYLDKELIITSRLDSIIYFLYSGKLLRVSGEIVKAQVPLYNALSLVDYTDSNLTVAQLYDELSIINRQDSINIDKAVYFIQESIKIKQILNDSSELSKSLVILGNIYYNKYKDSKNNIAYSDSTKLIYQDALRIIPNSQLKLINILKLNLGVLALEKGEYSESEKTLLEVLDYHKSNNDITNVLDVKLSLSSLYIREGKLNDAESYIIAIENDLDDDLRNKFDERIRNAKAEILELKGLTVESKRIKDSLFGEEYDKRMNEMSISNLKLNSEATNAQKEFQIQQRKTVESELSERRRQLIFIIAIGGFLFLLSVYYYRYQSLKKKSIESELEKTKIQATLDVTKAKMQGEEEERKAIASVLHDQIASLLTAADMHLTAAKNKGDSLKTNSIEKADEIIKDVNEQVRNLSHQLVSPTLLKFGLVPAIDSLVEKMQNDKINFLFEDKSNGLRIESSKEIFLFRSCSELIQNALKYSNGDRIDITLSNIAKTLELSVYDNGTTGKTEIDSQGIGLAHIKNNVEALLGSFELDVNETGFEVSISLPIT